MLARRAEIDASRRRATRTVVEDVLAGGAGRAYPPGVLAALRELESVRAVRPLATPAS